MNYSGKFNKTKFEVGFPVKSLTLISLGIKFLAHYLAFSKSIWKLKGELKFYPSDLK